jgi:hypothetical protein
MLIANSHPSVLYLQKEGQKVLVKLLKYSAIHSPQQVDPIFVDIFIRATTTEYNLVMSSWQDILLALLEPTVTEVTGRFTASNVLYRRLQS